MADTGGATTVTEGENPAEKLGWQFTAGVILIVGGYAAWPLIPVVVTAELSTGVKSVITAILSATPFLTKVLAIALMGRPAYHFFKRTVLKSLRLKAVRSRG